MGRADAVVVGSGPNGLAAAIVLARAGREVQVFEAEDQPGGGVRSLELTLPGFAHDLCSAVHPLAVASPFFRSLGLERHGLRWSHPDVPLAHPFDDGTAALLCRSTAETGDTLDPEDRDAWARLFDPYVEVWDAAEDAPRAWAVPSTPLLAARFGRMALRSIAGLARRRFRGPRATALFTGIAGHAAVPLDAPGGAAFGLVLGLLGHTVGWPSPVGGASRLTEALVAELRAHGGRLVTGTPVESLDALDARTVLLDVSVPELLRIAGDRLPGSYVRRLRRFRLGPGAYKVDWALSGPVPWTAEACRRAGTVHVGGGVAEIAASEAAPWKGHAPASPFLLVTQPTVHDPTRAPPGRHVLWAYAHAPNGWDGDLADAVEAQIERFAPGFRDLVLARCATGPRGIERRNRSMVGGDTTGGANVLRQLLFRPLAKAVPYRVPVRGSVWLCSASTPPGGGVHGMCGYLAARAALAAD